ncbi:MAG: hypothetical protein V4558_09435 [Gemmatimonadota bacterium]
MDRHAIMSLIPISFILVTGLLLFSRTRLGRAFATRIEGGALGEESRARLDALENDMDLLRQQLAETEERLEYSERMLIAQRLIEEHRDTPVP